MRPPSVAAAAMLVLLVVGGCGDDDPDRQPVAAATPWSDEAPELVLDVISSPGALPAFALEPSDVTVEVVAAPGGRLSTVAGPSASTGAVLFPTTAASSKGRDAVLRVVAPDDSGVLEPGSRDFWFGLDLRFPEETTSSEADNGDNLLQRGLFGDTGQLKLQADNGVPSCRVAGESGDVTVKANAPLPTERWFRVRCQRTAGLVTLYVGEIAASGTVEEWEHWSEEGPTGEIDFADPAPAVSIGGKLNPQGGLVEDAPDQFNGALAHVVYGVR
ncbi:MAG: hypothetical protein U0R78_00545 [Nocardioidaceae bacterium]